MAQQTSLTVSYINNIQLAEEEEQRGNIEKAIEYYEAAINEGRADELPYDRLMILYRKEKKYKDELRVINKGLKVFMDFYKKSTPKAGQGKKLSDLSEAFMKSAGLKDNKGQLLYQPEPIGRWTKRKEVVEGKINGPGPKGKRTMNQSQRGGRKNQISSKQGSKTNKPIKSKKKTKSKK